MTESVGFRVFQPYIIRSTGEITLWLDCSLGKDNIKQAVKEIIAFEKHLGMDV